MRQYPVGDRQPQERPRTFSGNTIAPGSTGNVVLSGTCSNGGGNTGMILFTNGTTCP
jgi:hypothetical protein